MSMNVGGESSGEGGDPEVLMDINTTPLIDVMLVLLIMLIITIPMQTHAVKLDLPQGNPPPPLTPPSVVTIDVDFDGTILWNGDPVPDEQQLQARLHQRLAAARPARDPPQAQPSWLPTRPWRTSWQTPSVWE